MAEWEILSDRPARGFQAPVQPASPQTGAGSWEILSDRPASSDPDVENKLLDRGRQLIQKEEADIDYSTGAPFSVRAQLQGAQNPTEAYKTLERTYGRGNFGQDRFDQWWVRQDVPSSKAGSLEQIAARHHGMPLETTSRRVAVLPKGLSGGLRNFFSGIVASPFATAGATLGAVGGEVVFPAGGGIPGAMAGAAAGKGLDQLTKWAMGTFAQKPAEVVGSMATEGSIAGVLQGAGPAVRTLKAPLQRALQRFSGVTPSSSMMARDLSAGGAVPPIGSYAPGATSLEYKRQLRDILSGPGGSAAEQKNILYLNSRMRSVLTNEGLAPPQVEQFMNEVGDTSARMSARTAGEAITSEAQRAHQGLVQTANTSRDEAERQLNHHTRVLESLSRAPASLGQSVADAIVTRRRQFGREMSDAYRAVDRMTGDTPIVPPVSIDKQARQIVSLLPPQ